MDNYPKSNQSIDKLITIACPFGGSSFGNLNIRNMDELKPNTHLLKELSTNKSNVGKIINFYPTYDNYILEKNMKLEGAQNKLIKTDGHILIYESQELILEILKILDSGASKSK